MRSGKSEQGFLYIGLLLFVVLMGIGLEAVSELWSLTAQRDREQELLFIGNQYRQAITHYYTSSRRGAYHFPHSLDELLSDDRDPERPMRHLRKLYPDPMTGKTDWGEVTLADGSIVGVYSTSLDRPIKSKWFAFRDRSFEDQTRYSDWVFRSALPAANPTLGGNGYSNNSGPSGNPAAPPPTVPNGPIRPTPGARPSGINTPFMGR